jgi:hypothetical protein
MWSVDSVNVTGTKLLGFHGPFTPHWVFVHMVSRWCWGCGRPNVLYHTLVGSESWWNVLLRRLEP